MNKELFLEIVKDLRKTSLDDYAYKHKDNKIYGFKSIGDGDDSWDDQGKYQYKTESGQLIEMDENYKEIKSFNFGVSRCVTRSGSYFSDYNYEYNPYEMYEIKEELIPEVIIPAHTELKWKRIKK